jgi:hypothetical protein
MIWWRIRNRVRELFWLPPLAPPSGEPVPPHPRLELVLGRSVPGALVRLSPALFALACGGLVGGLGTAGWVMIAAAAAALAWRPRRPVAAGFVLLVGLLVYAGEDLFAVEPAGTVPGLWRAAALIFVVHCLFSASALAGHVAWRALVETSVLGRAVRSVLGGQAIAQTLVLLTGWLRASLIGSAAQDWLRLVGVAAVVGIVVLAGIGARPTRAADG